MSEETKTNESKPVVHLTDAAIARIQSMMEKEDKKGYILRVGVSTGGCAGLSYDLRFQKKAYDNDHVSEQNGMTIAVNPEAAVFLKGTEIDYLDTLNVSGFQYKNPNANNSCGCGTSFS